MAFARGASSEVFLTRNGILPFVLCAVAAGGAVSACENNIYFGGEADPPFCKTDDCGGDLTRVSGAVTVAAIEHASFAEASAWLAEGHLFATRLCRNGDCLGDSTVTMSTEIACSGRTGLIDSCLFLKSQGEDCEGKAGPAEASWFVCAVIRTAAGRVPKQEGDRYQVVIRDEGGEILVDQTMTVHYEQVMPTNCNNAPHVECTNGFMFF
jgi:hypothetical protein